MLAAAVRARAAGATWRSGATARRGGAATAAWRSRASGRGAKAGAAATAAGAGVGGLLAAVRQDNARCAAEAAAAAEEAKAEAGPAAGTSSDEAPTREDAARYIPLAARIGKIFAVKKAVLLKAKAAAANNVRYLAYSSDVGESFRPVIPAAAVKATYGIAVGYVVCDVGYHTHQEMHLAEDVPKSVPRCIVHNTVFQLIASLALPAFIIHAGVHQAVRGFKKIGRFTKWGPTVVGLGMIPFLPATVDYPAEVAIDTAFAYAWPHPRGEHGHAYNLSTMKPMMEHGHGGNGHGDNSFGDGTSMVAK